MSNIDSSSKQNIAKEASMASGHASVECIYDSETNILSANISVLDEDPNITLSSLKEQVHRFGKNVGIEAPQLPDTLIKELFTRVENKEEGIFPLAEKSQFALVKFIYDIETRHLSAELSPTAEKHPYTVAGLSDRIKAEDFGKCGVKIAALNEVVINTNKNAYGTYFLAEKPEYTDVEIHFDEGSATLSMKLISCDDNPRHSSSTLQQILVKNHYDGFALLDRIIFTMMDRIKNNERGVFAIAKRKDAEIDISVDADYLHAFIIVKPPFGGKVLDEAMLHQKIQDANICLECCDKNVLSKILEEKVVDKIELATGRRAQKGADAQFKPLVEELVYKERKEDDAGNMDVREVNDFTFVEPGTKLMTRVPAQEGVNGLNIKNEVLLAERGEDIPFTKELVGVRISSDDKNNLEAEIKGHPILLRDGVRVENTLTVDNVSVATGDIQFDGSLLVKGEVTAGIKISVTGDVLVKGVVTNATIRAKNNITLCCGAVGVEHNKNSEGKTLNTVLKAGGNISAQYLHFAQVSAGRDVTVKEYISHCKTEARHQVLVGQDGGKGKIFGGSCYGHVSIAANEVGTNAAIDTYLIAGPPQDAQNEYNKLRANYATRLKQCKQLTKVLERFTSEPKNKPSDVTIIEKVQSIQKLIDETQKEKKQMSDIINDIEKIFGESRNSCIRVIKTTFSNVVIRINGEELRLRQQGKGGNFSSKQGSVSWTNN
jgi:uncharacterized protein (DUF342 family)